MNKIAQEFGLHKFDKIDRQAKPRTAPLKFTGDPIEAIVTTLHGADRPLKAVEIQRIVGIGGSTAKAALKRLRDRGKVQFRRNGTNGSYEYWIDR